MDKNSNRKSMRISGDRRERIGIPIGIHDQDGIELCTGDKIKYNNRDCIILFNREVGEFEAMILDSCWYADKKMYDPDSYGKSYRLPMDDGAKMHIKKLDD